MVSQLFLQVLGMSATASFVILAVLVVRLLLRRAPTALRYALWLVVLFRLVCPFSFQSAISLLPVPANAIPQAVANQQPPPVSLDIPAAANPVNAAAPGALQGWVTVAAVLWLCGMVALVVYSIVTLLRLRQRLRSAVAAGEGVYLAQGLSSPFVMGVFRAKIYLPADLAAQEKQYILLHEQTHIRRLDHLVKLVSFTVLCLHWFNPLVWVAFFLCGKDMEMSCDEAVIRKLGAEVKKDYSASLLSLATGRRIVGGSPLAFGEGDTKSRIRNVLHYKKPAFWVVAAAVVAVAVAAVALAANPLEKRPSMQWAKALRVGDIASVELVVMPSDPNSSYRLCVPEQFADIVWLVNGSRGRYIPEPEPIVGGGQTLYITLQDGTRHTVSNSGNTYLVIDGDSFAMSRLATENWEWYNSGDAPVPAGFWDEPAPAGYNGLSQEEYEGLAAERASYEAMSAEEQQLLLESGGVSCPVFRHLWWEDSIDLNLINLVGSDAFKQWVTQQSDQGQCSDIYSFAKEFGLDYPALQQVILDNDLTEIYPLERLRARAAVFGLASAN